MIASIIPARGGSKGIRYKNIVPFLGHPLLAYTVQQSVDSDVVDRTFLSTDDSKIATVGEEFDADVIDRPDELADDEATTESALLHALSEIRRRGIEPSVVVLLQCTSPLRREGDIEATARLVTEDGYDSALSVCRDHKFYWEDGEDTAVPVNYDPENRKRRQELEPRFQENGSIYAMKTEVLEEGCRLGGRIGLHRMPKSLSFEIDDEDDLRIVEAIGRNVEFYSGDLDVEHEADVAT